MEWSRKYDAKTLDEYVAMLMLLIISFSLLSDVLRTYWRISGALT